MKISNSFREKLQKFSVSTSASLVLSLSTIRPSTAVGIQAAIAQATYAGVSASRALSGCQLDPLVQRVASCRRWEKDIHGSPKSLISPTTPTPAEGSGSRQDIDFQKISKKVSVSCNVRQHEAFHQFLTRQQENLYAVAEKALGMLWTDFKNAKIQSVTQLLRQQRLEALSPP